MVLDCVGLDEAGQIGALCGITRGALPDAPKSRSGLASEAKGGTLIVERLDGATPGMQRRLLQLLAEGTVTPWGGDAARQADVRLMFTADADLRDAVAAGRFREDLLYRINVVPLHVPALRERRDDISALIDCQLAKHAERDGQARRFTDEAGRVLREYDWPGNLPELEAAVTYAVTMSPRHRLGPEDLPDTVTQPDASLDPSLRYLVDGGAVVVPALANGWTATALADALQEPERQIILAALEANGWNRSETARQLEIDRTTLYKKIKRFRLDEPASF